MTFRWNLIIFVIVMFTFNITEFECSKKTGSKKENRAPNAPVAKNGTFSHFTYPAMVTAFPLGISDVFDDASDVFRKIIGKMIANKKLVGMESGWYW